MKTETPGLRLVHNSRPRKHARRNRGAANLERSDRVELRVLDFRPNLYDSLARTARSYRLRRLCLIALWLAMAVACLALYRATA